MNTATHHTPPKHGERRCYLRGCDRPECRNANRRYCKAYRLRRETTGDVLRVPVAQVAHLVNAWTRQGWSQRQIAEAAGCSDRVIHNILTGTIKGVRPDIAQGILAAKLGESGDEGRSSVDATGTRRRIQALAAAGWPFREIAERAGVHENTPGRVLNRPRIYVGTANAIADVYDQISTLDPQQYGITAFAANKTRNHARAQGWPDPTFWEDYGGIDDPDAPETEPAARRGAFAEARHRADEIRHLARYGVPPEEIAARVSTPEKTVRVQYVREVIAGTRGPGWREQQEVAA